MTYLYVAVEVLVINAVVFTAVALVARRAIKQVGQMLNPMKMPYVNTDRLKREVTAMGGESSG